MAVLCLSGTPSMTGELTFVDTNVLVYAYEPAPARSIVSACRSGARSLLTEDLQDGRRFDRLEIVSPFRNPSAGKHSTGFE